MYFLAKYTHNKLQMKNCFIQLQRCVHLSNTKLASGPLDLSAQPIDNNSGVVADALGVA